MINIFNLSTNIISICKNGLTTISFQYKSISKIIKSLPIFLFIFLFWCIFASSAEIYFQDTIIPILTYHNFTDEKSSSYKININQFDQQMNYLATHGYSVISLSELLEGISNQILPANPVVITIDDGYKSTYTLAYPILKKYHFPATFFIYTDFIEKNKYSLTWKELREMEAHGIEIGSHTLSHCNLLKIGEEETQTQYLNRIRKEIILSKKILEENLETPVQFFAYPYGIYNSYIKYLAIQAGYKGIVNVNNMNNTMDLSPYSLSRQIIFGQYSIDSFVKILLQRPLAVAKVFPEDGYVSTNQFSEIGAILNDKIYPNSIFTMKLGGAKVDYDYDLQNHKISFTPNNSKPLMKKTYIVSITAQNKQNELLAKKSWLITIQ